MKKWKLYHNPQCSKSREVLKFLQDNGVDIEVIEYLKHPPTEEELAKIVGKLRGSLKFLVRTKEEDYQNQSFDVNSEKEVIKNLAARPRLLERPLLVTETEAVIGRPFENIESLVIQRG